MLAREVFKEFITRDEPHPIAKSSSSYFEDAWRTVFNFNGTTISVVQGKMFYTDKEHPYEAYVIEDKTNKWSGDPHGYLDEFDLIGLLYKIKEGKCNGTK